MYKPAAKRRWGYFALPVLHHDRLVGKLDAKADRKAGVFSVNALHEDEPLDAGDGRGRCGPRSTAAAWLGLEPPLGLTGPPARLRVSRAGSRRPPRARRWRRPGRRP